MALSTGALHAAVISHTYNYGPATAPFSQSFDLDLFNSDLGTLTEVKITLNAESTASIEVFNFTGANQNFTKATASIPITVTGPGGGLVDFNLIATLANGVAAAGLNIYPGIPGSNSVCFGGSADAEGSIIVDYTYESSVPEPATYAMIGGGLALLGLLRRRRA